MSLQCRGEGVAQAANADVKPVWHFIVLKPEKRPSQRRETWCFQVKNPFRLLKKQNTCVHLILIPHAALLGLWAQLPAWTKTGVYALTVRANVVSLSIGDLI